MHPPKVQFYSYSYCMDLECKLNVTDVETLVKRIA